MNTPPQQPPVQPQQPVPPTSPQQQPAPPQSQQPPTLAQLEQLRTTYLAKRRKAIKISIIVFIVAITIIMLYAHFISTPSSSGQSFTFETIFEGLLLIVAFAGVYAVISAIIISIATGSVSKQYTLAYKSYFVAGTITQLFQNVTYRHDQGLSEQALLATGFANTGDSYHSEDYISATYRQIPFQQADVTIREQHTDSEGHTYWVTIFAGRWFVFDFPRKFHFKMAVVGKRFGASTTPKDLKLQPINTESAQFNKMYRVLAQDGVEAFYLLPPDLLSTLETIGERHRGRVFLCFSDNQLQVAIGGLGNSLEPPSPKHPLDHQKEFAKVTGDLQLITHLIDSLKLSR